MAYFPFTLPCSIAAADDDGGDSPGHDGSEDEDSGDDGSGEDDSGHDVEAGDDGSSNDGSGTDDGTALPVKTSSDGEGSNSVVTVLPNTGTGDVSANIAAWLVTAASGMATAGALLIRRKRA